MMILIFSEELEQTTDEVVQWLISQGISFLRINKEDSIKIIELSLNNERLLLELNGKIFNINEFDAIWYRRGNLNNNYFQSALLELSSNSSILNQAGRFLGNEWIILQFYIFYVLERKSRVLGSFQKSLVNKLINLSIAKQCGLLIPDTTITSKGYVVKNKLAATEQISKPISESETFQNADGSILKMLTEVVTIDDVDEEKDFFPSLIQKNIKKWIELRVFFLGNRFYSMAIFSQSNSKTTTDFRNYDNDKSNRMVPFNLPKSIEINLLKFMKHLGLNTGSIDMIVTPEREYVFLEVNPAGNIEMVSKNCNYPIEQEIANFLGYGAV
ncbi:hypothetical protein DSECCO2_79870 [anaerobic digester metagenome]|nr:grasp-with-spasm system ATP-grasp peptide maturase [Tenuifilaceae bacterium]